MSQITLQIPDGLPQMLKLSEKDFQQEMQMLLAVKLFELGKLTSGKAAELAGVPRKIFLYELQHYGVPAINLRDEEVEYEIEAAANIAL